MKIIELNKTIGIQTLSYYATKFKMINENEYSFVSRMDNSFSEPNIFYRSLPVGFTFLSLHSEMTEEKAKSIMPLYEQYGYRLFNERPDILVKTALESYHSLIKSLDYMTSNPLKEEDHTIGNIKSIQWQEAQRQVVELLILIKEK